MILHELNKFQTYAPFASIIFLHPAYHVGNVMISPFLTAVSLLPAQSSIMVTQHLNFFNPVAELSAITCQHNMWCRSREQASIWKLGHNFFSIKESKFQNCNQVVQMNNNKFVLPVGNGINILDFKLSPCCICSFGYFPGVRLWFADVSEPSVRSIFKGWMWNMKCEW
jgi:hypothetical protein